MVPRSDVRTIVVDASVLINVLVLGRLDLFGQIPGLDFIVPAAVVREVTRPEQASELKLALANKLLREVDIVGREGQLYARLRDDLGVGESACLALAASGGFAVASDDSRRFPRLAEEHLGNGRVVTMPGLMVLAIRAGLITVEEADEMKATLERNRFRIPSGSFRERVS